VRGILKARSVVIPGSALQAGNRCHNYWGSHRSASGLCTINRLCQLFTKHRGDQKPTIDLPSKADFQVRVGISTRLNNTAGESEIGVHQFRILRTTRQNPERDQALIATLASPRRDSRHLFEVHVSLHQDLAP